MNNVKKAFQKFPNATKVFETPDGQVFLNENRANLHAGPKGVVKTHSKSDVAEKVEKKITAVEAIDKINEAETVEDLKPFEGDTRKTVIEAYNEKLEALNPED